MIRNVIDIRAYDHLVINTKLPSKRVYICSPLKGRIRYNTNRAREYCRYAFEKGYVPLAPHLYFPQFLDEGDIEERKAGLRYGLESMWQVSEVWVFGERISEGMRAEIELAEDLDIPIRYFSKSMEAIR